MPEIERAYNRYFNYVQDDLMRKNRRVDDDSSDDEPVVKKRKTEAKPNVKPSVKPDVKPDVKPSIKADVKPNVPKAGASSFFAGPPKAIAKATPNLKGLPSFKKRPAPLVTPSATAGPSRPASSLLASTMQRLKKESPPPPSAPLEPMRATDAARPKTAGKLNRKGHTVRWVDDTPGYSAAGERPLEAIREFTEAPHELEPAPWRPEDVSNALRGSQLTVQGAHGMSVHQLDRQEGNVMHHRVYDDVEPAMEWSAPAPYDGQYIGPPGPTQESATQEQRERTVLAVSYVAGQEPITPDDIGVRIISQDATTAKVNTQHHYHGSGAMPGADPVPTPAPIVPPIAATSVGDLLRTLNLPSTLTVPAPAPAPAPVAQPYGGGYDYQPAAPAYGYNHNHQQAYGATSHHGRSAHAAPPANRWDQSRAPGFAHAQPHSSHAQPHAQGYNSSNNRGAWRGRGAGGFNRGGGTPYRTRPCKFWLEGTCKEGEACTFLHERR